MSKNIMGYQESRHSNIYESQATRQAELEKEKKRNEGAKYTEMERQGEIINGEVMPTHTAGGWQRKQNEKERVGESML